MTFAPIFLAALATFPVPMAFTEYAYSGSRSQRSTSVAAAKNRDRIRERMLQEFGIETRPFYIPMHKLPIYRRDIPMPHAEFLSDHGIVLPTYSGLKDEEVDEISEALAACLCARL
jgi:dTDP-4-amino-4,6-dideoxygalactose transaminase